MSDHSAMPAGHISGKDDSSTRAATETATGARLRSRSSFKWWLILVGVVIVAVIAWRVAHPPGASAGKAATAKGAANAPVPVVAGTVAQKDVPIYLDGLGTVQAFNTVVVRVRVDGQLEKVAFTEGQDVRAGDVLAKIDPAPFQAQLEQAEAKKAQDEAQLANALVQVTRNAALLQQKILSQQDYDTQKALADQFTAAVKADQAAIDSARVQLGYTTITSPIDGRTGIRVVDQGNIVHPTDSNGLVTITQLKPISVLFTLPEQTLKDINEHRSGGELTVLAVGRDNQTVLDQGTLTVIDNQIDTGTGTIKLKATFPNAQLRLWPGQFVNTRLLLATRKGGTVIPASVVQRGPQGPYAFVINDDMTVQIKPVKVAQIEAGMALIDEGLRPGERVVVEGQYRLQAGSRVKPGRSAKSDESESAP